MNLKQQQAVTELINSDELLVDAKAVAPVLGSDPQIVRAAAREGSIGFPVICYGSKVLIPRVPFLRYLGIAAEVII